MNLYQLGDLKKNLPEMRPGDTVRVYEKVPEEKRKKSQVFEGILISRKHGKGINATFTVRAILEGVGIEKTYPLHSPLIEKIEIIKKGKTRRAKLYYLREKSERKIRKKLRSKMVEKTKNLKEETKSENKREVEEK
ncbi:50S ribosomal protein L19 [bacterium]|nr:50S ribosomal protein L19 [bacterium]